jgi:hypothetical protein
VRPPPSLRLAVTRARVSNPALVLPPFPPFSLSCLPPGTLLNQSATLLVAGGAAGTRVLSFGPRGAANVTAAAATFFAPATGRVNQPFVSLSAGGILTVKNGQGENFW